jgi:hypothetical protein
MTNDLIEKFLSSQPAKPVPVMISFRSRNAIKGLFIKTADYGELSAKNFWRIVSESSLPAFKASGDNNLAKIFNGNEFTKLSIAK